MPPRSPLAPATEPSLPPIRRRRLAARACGVRYQGRTDVCLIEFTPGTTIAGVLTRSLTASAPVDWCRAALKGGRARAILVNSGNANAFTGKLGEASVRRCAAAAASALGCAREEVFLASTGVIGEPLADERITAGLPDLTAALAEDGWAAAAAAIMTTDTFPKLATRQARIGGVEVHINGIAKGSGMIAPDMATMLAFVATDAKLPAPVLRALLREASDRSFNCITVDGDTSTSDTLLLAATGAAPAHPRIARADDPKLSGFPRQAAGSADRSRLPGGPRRRRAPASSSPSTSRARPPMRAARRIGLAIANSPLVKTAIAGEDANWGRIVMAVGKAGEKADRDRLKIAIGGVKVAARGQRVPDYDETPIAAHMKGSEIAIAVDVGVGKGRARVWTCDLTHGYIDINADYRS